MIESAALVTSMHVYQVKPNQSYSLRIAEKMLVTHLIKIVHLHVFNK